jgi:threonine dehydrogenase-like Zn-dependent dehydrogenase
MKALVKTGPGPGLELADVDVPRPRPDEALIRITKTSICGTDLHIDEWAPRSKASMSGCGSPEKGTSPAATAATAGRDGAITATTTDRSV